MYLFERFFQKKKELTQSGQKSQSEPVLTGVILPSDLIERISSTLLEPNVRWLTQYQNLQSLTNLLSTCSSFSKYFRHPTFWKYVSTRLFCPPCENLKVLSGHLLLRFNTSSQKGLRVKHAYKLNQCTAYEDKKGDYNDIHVALLGFPLSKGKVYVSIVNDIHDEIFFGITDRPQEVQKITSSSIINQKGPFSSSFSFRFLHQRNLVYS